VVRARTCEQENRTAKWHQDLEDDAKAMKWIKKDYDATTPKIQIDQQVKLHPQQKAEDEANKLRALWNPTTVPTIDDTNHLRHLLDDCYLKMATPWINGAELQRLAPANAGKAAGPDEWQPAQWSL